MEAVVVIAVLVVLVVMTGISRRIGKLEAETKALRAALVRAGVDMGPAPSGPPAASPPPVGPKASDRASAGRTPTPDAEPVAMRASGESDRKSTPATPPPLPSAKQKRRSAADFEKLVGASWSVILGGIAIALGALFLVRYSIEAGLLGPGARIAAGTLFSAALFAAGEWLRRRDRELDLPVFHKADVPGILTGAGAIGAFGTLYAAHALYHFVGPGVAFLGLTVIGIASLLLSSIHGPKLAAIGLLGAYGAPSLVSSGDPNPVALALHTLVVTASVMAVSRIRDWLWLAVGGVVGGCLWAFLIAAVDDPAVPWAGAILLACLAALFAATFGWEKSERPVPLQDRPWDRPGVVSFVLIALVYAEHCLVNAGFPALPAGLAVGAIIVVAAGIWPALSVASGAASLVVLAGAAAIDLPLVHYPGLILDGEGGDAFMPADIGAYVGAIAFLAVPVAALAMGAARRAAATAPRMAGNLAVAGSVIAVFTPVIAYLRISPFETDLLFGTASIAIALLLVLLAELFTRARPGDWSAPAPAAFAVAAIALLSFGLGVSLSATWMPFGFALTAAGIAWVYRARPLAALPYLAIAASLLAALGLWASAPFPGEAIGTTPFLNRLVVIVGLPAAAVLLGGEILRRAGAARTGSIVTAIGLALLAFFVGLELRHWINGGDIIGGHFRLADMAVQTIAALGFSIGLQRVARFTRARVFDLASLVAGGFGAAMSALGLLLVFNPLLTGDSVGEGAVLNMLLPAYLVTAVLAAVVALLARPVRPRWYTLSYALLAGLLAFAYFTLMTRHAFQGERIGLFRSTSDMEFWTYSAVWLVLGAVVLAAGLGLRSLPLRVASAVVIALTVCKVFLLDMTALAGALRAFSFMGLGISLLAIGRFYQRILVRTGNAEPQ
ncbi:DUF2339 domain-containing protein [Oricola thermophila]|uniref:DUF2339 domain-containing protein n=1 Tax=Oricola thermophila TaxID=2742145 RepID=A0A6N1VHK1_9HYPH|nr:DUF2339 domain-containing protein [Oricola thermophila]QKV18477.1 DUF2339 domain-containing protein [Oricola thermophila]